MMSQRARGFRGAARNQYGPTGTHGRASAVNQGPYQSNSNGNWCHPVADDGPSPPDGKEHPRQSAQDDRSRQLNKLFYGIVEGRRLINSVTTAEGYLEAIYSRTDKPDCLERLAASKVGRDRLREALLLDTSPRFINSHVSKLLGYLCDPAFKRLCNGEFLKTVVWDMVDPPRFWDKLVELFKGGALESDTIDGFGWLLLQLVLLPLDKAARFREAAQSLGDVKNFTCDISKVANGLFQKVNAIVRGSSGMTEADFQLDNGPGGRHDNDFVSFYDISIFPTRAEIESVERPFYRSASALLHADSEQRAHLHLDNQFRLLRDDMLAEMREDLKAARIEKTGNPFRKNIIRNLRLVNIDAVAMQNDKPCSLVFDCGSDLLDMPNDTFEHRKKALKDSSAFRHESFGCLMKDANVIAFATLSRNEDLLAEKSSKICLTITDAEPLNQVFTALAGGPLDFLFVSTPIFAYQPILERLQQKTEIEFPQDILRQSGSPASSPLQLTSIIEALKSARSTGVDLQQVFGTTKPLHLDVSQVDAIIYALVNQVSSIVGPPGTGKSLVGSLIVKLILDHTEETILVLAYTNHALDQFAEDLMSIGIDYEKIVRLGSKSTPATEKLRLANQTADLHRQGRTRYEMINLQKTLMRESAIDIEDHIQRVLRNAVSTSEYLDHLEFSDLDGQFFDAFRPPVGLEEGEVVVGRKNTPIKRESLFENWLGGQKAFELLRGQLGEDGIKIWEMDKKDRRGKKVQWRQEILKRRVHDLVNSIESFNQDQRKLQSLWKKKNEQILQSKRIILCTTTGASKYAEEIFAAAPGVIVTEEAGEIFESHILAAMAPDTKQLIQIGDHKQLRPKVKNYALTVESGRGYDLNRSMFERLILQGHPHAILLNQHRMRPEISALIKHNYPDLKNATGTQNRPHLRGFQQDVVFFDHNMAETKTNNAVDKLDHDAKSSKQNVFEAEMVLKCVRYLAQQGYGTSHLVVLTPYLGQLSLLRNRLSLDHDPVLSDVDSYSLVQAGLLPASSANVDKKKIKLSTIDNYQGEESDVVVVSLTRSNANGDIGFMSAPERLNVLVSRARNALIMIGNSSTFMNAKKGHEEWNRLFIQLKSTGSIHDGFPLKCEKHPSRTLIAKTPEDFDLHCPDGGCAEPCAESLSCGKHMCPRKCHMTVDHSKMPCMEVMKDFCPKQHVLVWDCYKNKPPSCQECRREKEARERKARREKELETERQAKQRAYQIKLSAIQDETNKQRKIIQERQEEERRRVTLQQHQKELDSLRKQAEEKPKTSQAAKTANTATIGSNGEPRRATQPGPQAEKVPSSGVDPISNPSSPQSEEDTDSESSMPMHQEAREELLPMVKSHTEQDWADQKAYENASNEAIDSLMAMIGLESVKKEFLRIKARVDTTVRQGVDLKDERFSAALLGNPGTGKTTVARLYGKFLSSVGAIPGDHFEETTGSRLANDGIQGCKQLIDNILEKRGGVFFLDEAYQIVSGLGGGSQVLDFLLAEIENLTGKVVFVFAGYRKQMEDFFSHNPGIPSRVPISLSFEDYEDNELLRIMNFQLDKKYRGRMAIQAGNAGLYMRIVSRRIGHGRGREGFGNAREVQNVLSFLLGRQADRLHRERRRGLVPDDMILTKFDLIGPEPKKALSGNKDWKRLQDMIGLKSVKDAIQVLVDRLQTNYDRELAEQPLVEGSLNKVFLGNPGTGKTTVAKLYGKILTALGLLSNGEVVIKNPADFVGAHLGQSEKNTKAILDSTKGKVLIIDEAYMLAGGGKGVGNTVDPYKTAVVDTIVAEIQSTATEDRCVLLLGYKDQMESMFRDVNPGLTRRFPIASGFTFEDYSSSELNQILDLKLKQQGFRVTGEAKKVFLELLERARHKTNFGNAGEVDIILNAAKERQQQRLSASPKGAAKPDMLEPEDIDPDFDRMARAATNIHLLFQDVVGNEDIIERLEGYQQVVQNMKANDMDPRTEIPFSFLFRGPPGTGKTTTARKMGKVYYDMGFLGQASVIECSATDIIGQFVGQTGPKVQTKFDEALGKVLFIDEAYRLADGHFAKEAMDEIVDCLTKEKYKQKLVVILAGYEDDINRLMAQNPGLTSRFPETISFPNLPPHHCRDLLMQNMKRKRLDVTGLESSKTLDAKLLDLFSRLSTTPGWGNARDVQTLAKEVFKTIMKSKNPITVVAEELVVNTVQSMIDERTARAKATATPLTSPQNLPYMFAQADPSYVSAPQTSTSTSMETKAEEGSKDENPEENLETSEPSIESSPVDAATRDTGVSDEAWNQLQRDKAAAEQRQKELLVAERKAKELEIQLKEQEAALQREMEEAARQEMLKELERIRIERETAERKRRERQKKMKRELEVRARLEMSGVCPVGYRWISQSDGYRCAGGSHFMSNKSLGI